MRVPADRPLIRHLDVGGRTAAWSATGSGAALVVGGWWSSHLEADWEDAVFRRFAERLAEHATVVRYDRPGTGASDRTAPPPATLEEEVAILDAIIAAQGGPVALLGASSGGPVAAAVAARHPDRVRRLVLYGTYANGAEIAPPDARETLLDVVARHWGIGTRMLSDVFLPDAPAADREAFARRQRRSAAPESAAASMRAVYGFDVRDELPRITAPTLVLHRRDDRAIPFALGRDVAQRIPGARFVALDGRDHLPWRGDTGTLLAEVAAFLGARAAAPAAAPARHPGLGALSARERAVLELVARGLTDARIAEELVLSPHTVHRHVANIRTKLGVATRAAAAAAWAAGDATG